MGLAGTSLLQRPVVALAHPPLPPTSLSPAYPHPPCLPALQQLVFALVSVGAIVLTVNVVLLGGTIGFFQSLCLLGYCLFPMDVAAIVCVAVKIMLVRCGAGLGGQHCAVVPTAGATECSLQCRKHCSTLV